MYCTHINEEGEIVRLSHLGSINTVEDRSMEDGLLVIHTDISLGELNTSYWDFDTSSFKIRDGKPSKHARWENKQWVIDTEQLMKEFRALRNGRLTKSDWSQVSDAPLTDVQKELWRVYRQSLRDLTDSYPNLQTLDEVKWPTAPGE